MGDHVRAAQSRARTEPSPCPARGQRPHRPALTGPAVPRTTRRHGPRASAGAEAGSRGACGTGLTAPAARLPLAGVLAGDSREL